MPRSSLFFTLNWPRYNDQETTALQTLANAQSKETLHELQQNNSLPLVSKAEKKIIDDNAKEFVECVEKSSKSNAETTCQISNAELTTDDRNTSKTIMSATSTIGKTDQDKPKRKDTPMMRDKVSDLDSLSNTGKDCRSIKISITKKKATNAIMDSKSINPERTPKNSSKRKSSHKSISSPSNRRSYQPGTPKTKSRALSKSLSCATHAGDPSSPYIDRSSKISCQSQTSFDNPILSDEKSDSELHSNPDASSNLQNENVYEIKQQPTEAKEENEIIIGRRDTSCPKNNTIEESATAVIAPIPSISSSKEDHNGLQPLPENLAGSMTNTTDLVNIKEDLFPTTISASENLPLGDLNIQCLKTKQCSQNINTLLTVGNSHHAVNNKTLHLNTALVTPSTSLPTSARPYIPPGVTVKVESRVAPVQQHINDRQLVQQILLEGGDGKRNQPFKLRRSLSDGNVSPQVPPRILDVKNKSSARCFSFHPAAVKSGNNEVAEQGSHTGQPASACCNLPTIGARLAHCDSNECSSQQPPCCGSVCKQVPHGYHAMTASICSETPSPQACSCFQHHYTPNSYISCQDQLNPFEFQHCGFETNHKCFVAKASSNPIIDPECAIVPVPSRHSSLRNYHQFPMVLPVQPERLLDMNRFSNEHHPTAPPYLDQQPLPPTPQPVQSLLPLLHSNYKGNGSSPVPSRYPGLWSGCCHYPGMMTHFTRQEAYGDTSSCIPVEDQNLSFSRPQPMTSTGCNIQNNVFQLREPNRDESGFPSINNNQRSRAKLRHSLHCNKPDLLSMESCSRDVRAPVVAPNCLLVPCGDPGLDLRYIDNSPSISPIPVTRSKSCDSALYPSPHFLKSCEPQENYRALHPSNFGYDSFEGYSDSRFRPQSECSFEAFCYPPSNCDCESEHTSRSGTAYDSVNVSTNASSVNGDLDEDDGQLTNFDESFYIDENGFEKKKKVTFQLPTEHFASALSVHEKCKSRVIV